ncbi:hypothetical protein B005_5349 [Nocardiopsis alba ATCC BAA-2165]|uniref:Uncharacterized protein n=1 Tax=Nocardiopsis alba (strain ATCC BAA-2165 / BE74) TaxID=1205910 RepID=J7LGC8_NOCAA|nr:hypothetical protein B005_5349 [Nocardiopsis alba ATCC BAA-2165]
MRIFRFDRGRVRARSGRGSADGGRTRERAAGREGFGGGAGIGLLDTGRRGLPM